MIWHPHLEERWKTFPVHQQILMICNELNRAENLQSDTKEYKNALERALELMDFTIDDPKNHSCLREILRARRLMAGYYIDKSPRSAKKLQHGLVQLSSMAWLLLGGG